MYKNILFSCLFSILSFFSLTSICNAEPIHDACKAGNLQEVNNLLDSGTDVNERVKNNEYCTETPLLTAIWNEKTEIVRELIRRGADVKASQQSGFTTLHYAAHKKNTEIIQLLLDNGAKEIINRQIYFGDILVDSKTPLCIAMGHYHTEVARLLILNGADVNIGDHNGHTPLHTAAFGGFTDIVDLLIEHKANVNAIQPGSSFTALHAAASGGHKEIMDTLIAHGADPTVKTWTGKTAADILAERIKTQEYLAKKGRK